MFLVGVIFVSASTQAFYSPEQGRWLSRDPIEEEGGNNLYVFAANNGISNFDAYGLRVSGWFDLYTGIMQISDTDTGESITLCGESGGKPFGEPIPIGPYEILNHPNNDFFRLDPIDKIPRNDIQDETGRTYFRLHKPGRTIGCVAAKAECGDCWNKVRDLIRKTRTEDVAVSSKRRWPLQPKKEIIKKFGSFSVKNTQGTTAESDEIKTKCKCSCGHE